MLFSRKTKRGRVEEEGRTPIKFRRRRGKRMELDPKKAKRRKIRRAIILTFVTIILGAGLYFGLSAYNALKKMFAEGGDLFSLLAGHGQTQFLKGESNGRVNVLLLGVGDKEHAGADLSDTIMVVSYDVKTKSVAMFSIPRDLEVKLPKYGSYTKINAAHSYGESNKYPGGGPGLAAETVSQTLDIPIHYYVRADFSGFKDVVDAIGGVTVDVENSFCDYDYPVEYKGDTSKVCFDKGKQNMNGIKALQYARSRHSLGPEGSDFARSKRQQRLLVAIKDKVLSSSTLTNPKKILDLMNALGEHIKTDAQMAELLRVYELAKGVDTSKIINKNFDNSPEGLLVSTMNANGSVLKPASGNFKAIQAVVKNIFSVVAMREEKATVALYNGTWSTGLVTKLATEMKADGYNIGYSGDNDKKNVTKTIITDFTDGKKPETIKTLEAKFGVKATKQTSSSPTFDIKVVVGSDYLN